LLLIAFIDFPTFLVANVIVDLEPFLVISLGLNYPLHGFFHSLVGGTLLAFVLAFVMFKLRRFTFKVMKFFRLEHTASWKSVLAASLSGVYLHILLDAPLYSDIRPFYPFDVNPLLSSSIAVRIYIYMLCIFSFLAGAVIYMLRLVFKAFKKPKMRGNDA
jgi:membrane-bound metal-dependent hydrolase YbcI (DUF457 family)